MSEVRLKVEGTVPQTEFWLRDARYRAFVGGVGSGKTYAGVLEILRQPEGTRGAVIAPTYRMLMDATLDTLMKIFDRAGIIENWSKSEMRLTTVHGTDIIFRSGDDPEKLRGPNLGWFFLDEAAMMPELVWDIMLGRLRLDPGRAWCTTTPKGMNWVHRLFVGEKREDYALTQCSSHSNIFLPKYFLDSLESKYKGAWKEQELMGEFVDWVNAPAYEDFHRNLHVRPNMMEEYRDRLPIKLAVDFNARCMVWPVIQVNGRTPRVLTEIVQVGRTSIPKMVQEFRLAFPNHSGGVQIFGDASGLGLAAQTGQNSFDAVLEAFRGYPSHIDLCVPKTNPLVRSSVNSMNAVLRGTGEWEPLMIDESCDMIIRDFAFVEWDAKGTNLLKIDDLNDERSTLTHATDALRYWASIDSPISSVYISREDDNFVELPREDARRRAWMKRLKGEEPNPDGLFGLEL
ncbi:MAG TPA: phage terminase large subunit [Anaerolineae bacterium]|nr:phage terminase large subunit [Anaerolineae bacterium]